VGGINSSARETLGWVAQKLSDGTELIGIASKLPGTDIPDKGAGAYLHSPIQTPYRITQLWGENPQIYGAITYDGAPLRGHNGIDFGAPPGTPLTAVEAGVVAEAIYNDPTGFGNYVKLRHAWGESLYAHMDSIHVQQGQQINRGQVIGTSGNTGFSNGPHLHFAIRIAPYDRKDGWGGFSDPLPYLNPAEVLLPAYVLPPSALGDGPQFAFSMPAQGVAPDAPTYTSLEKAPGLLPEQPGVRRP
jgi:murein DD-endopeptidase MepM/ murein hydrolase activator NlpD